MRGQAHTVEAFAAAVLIIGGLIFATQATAVTPLSASTSNQHIENQQQASIEGLLATSAENGNLAEAVLYWDAEEETFVGAPESGVYAKGPPGTSFGEALNTLLSDRQIAFNVVVRYPELDGGTDTEPMVQMGQPSNNAVAATRSIGLYDGDVPAGFYAPDIGSGQLYTVVEVEVIAWRK